MKRFAIVILALLAPPVLATPAAAQQTPASGHMSLSVHAHSSQFTDTLFASDPLETTFAAGDAFSYSSIPCSRPAPFNDTSLNFSPDYPGVEDPASTRHFVEGTITSVDGSGRTGTVEGTITTILCVGGEESQSTITTAYTGRFVRSYEIAGGTGIFDGLEGRGAIRGSLTCLPRTLEATGAQSCADLGVYADAVFNLSGGYMA